MSYQIEIRLAAKTGWHTPAEAKAFYGRYSREGFTVHWWNSPDRVQDADHDKIVNYILARAANPDPSKRGSAHYVLSNTKITMLVNPDNVAWHAFSGNPTTIGVEFSPHLDAEGYKKAGWLLSQLEARYGRVLKLYKHSDWSQTACPGTLSPTRIREEADKWKRGDYNPKPTPVPAVPVVDEWKAWDEGKIKYVANKEPVRLYNFNSEDWSMEVIKTFNKGDIIEIYGQALNTKLNRVYYLTEHSFSRRLTHGFHPADLDVYVEPRPVPVPPAPTPVPEPTPEPTPEPAPEPDRNAVIAFLVTLAAKLAELAGAVNTFLGRYRK